MRRYQVFTDPLYGSERYIQFEPEWIETVEDRIMRLVPWVLPSRHYPATFIQLKDGRHYLLDGHHAAEIQAARDAVVADAAPADTAAADAAPV